MLCCAIKITVLDSFSHLENLLSKIRDSIISTLTYDKIQYLANIYHCSPYWFEVAERFTEIALIAYVAIDNTANLNTVNSNTQQENPEFATGLKFLKAKFIDESHKGHVTG